MFEVRQDLTVMFKTSEQHSQLFNRRYSINFMLNYKSTHMPVHCNNGIDNSHNIVCITNTDGKDRQSFSISNINYGSLFYS